jgi:hypothetical protein
MPSLDWNSGLADLTFRVLKNRKPPAHVTPGGESLKYPTSYTIVLEKPKPPRTCWERLLEND